MVEIRMKTLCMDASRAAICAGVLIKVRSHLLLFYPVDVEMCAFVSNRIGNLIDRSRVEDVNKKPPSRNSMMADG
jgi:hypothetical protein